MNINPDEHAHLARQAQKQYAENLAFSAAYKAMMKAAQHILDQFGKMGVPAERGVEFVHCASVALAQGFRDMANEHMKVSQHALDEMEKRQRALGRELYRKQWAVLLKAEGPKAMAVAKSELDQPTASGLVGLDGRPL